VPANAGWVGTGLILLVGQPILITSEGVIDYDGLDPNAGNSDSDGDDSSCDKATIERIINQKLTLDCLLTGVSWGALVGRIEENGTPFLIGSKYHLIADTSGELFLGVNDCCNFADNSGEFKVTIELTPTEVIKQFNQCDADHWRDEDCFIPLEALADGSYLDWLNANWNPNLPIPDPKKVGVVGSHPLFLGSLNSGDLPLVERVYAIGFSYNWTKCGVTWGGVSHEMICTIIPIAMSISNSPGETAKWVFLREQAYDESDAAATAAFKKAEAAGTLIFGGFLKDQKTGLSIVDDGVDQIDFLQITLRYYPDIYDRFLKFQETLDPRWLSGKGLVMNVFL
jgi:hypothetical protein